MSSTCSTEKCTKDIYISILMFFTCRMKKHRYFYNFEWFSIVWNHSFMKKKNTENMCMSLINFMKVDNCWQVHVGAKRRDTNLILLLTNQNQSWRTWIHWLHLSVPHTGSSPTLWIETWWMLIDVDIHVKAMYPMYRSYANTVFHSACW